MRAPRLTIIAAAIVPVIAFLTVWLVATSAPPVRVRVVDLTTDSHGLWAPPIGSQRAYAIIEVTNTGNRPILYSSPVAFMAGRPQFARTIVSFQCNSGWSPHPTFRLGCLKRLTLSPCERMTFVTVIDSDRPCRVAFEYSDGRPPSRIWEWAPRWLTRKLPSSQGFRTATTDTIDWQQHFRSRKLRHEAEASEQTSIESSEAAPTGRSERQ